VVCGDLTLVRSAESEVSHFWPSVYIATARAPIQSERKLSIWIHLRFNCHFTALSQTDAYFRRELLRRTKRHCFLVRLDYAKAFDRYRRTRIDTIDGYLTAANESRPRIVSVADISHRTVHF